MVTTNQHVKRTAGESEAVELNPVFVRAGEATSLPKSRPDKRRHSTLQ